MYAATEVPMGDLGPDDEEQACFTDEELTALALAADPDEPLGSDALPYDMYPGAPRGGLPSWYMPPVMARRVRGWRVPAVYVVIASFLLIDAFGLCITYGQLVAA
jgi:hypothetical protein